MRFCALAVGLMLALPAVNTGGCGVAPKPSVDHWLHARLDGIEIVYRERGDGDAVVFVHAGLFADWFEPLLQERALTDRYRLVSYHRVGYAGSSALSGAVSIADQAGHLRSLLRELSIERAHIVGHSSGGLIALQLALDHPELVRSIALLEPALPLAGAPQTPGARSGIATALEEYSDGDRSGAVDTFMRTVAGADYRVALEHALPRAFAHAAEDADIFFEQELPAVRQWVFHEEQARRVHVPVLAVIGERSPEISPIWRQRQELLKAWLPDVEPFVLRDATHLLHVQNPRAMAERLAEFFSQNSQATTAVIDE